MGIRAILPLIDLVFLTLGAILAAMTQMEKVEALDLEIAGVSPGAAVVTQGDFSVLSVHAMGMELDGEPVTMEALPERVAGLELVIRAERTLETQDLLSVVAEAVKAGATVRVEVEEIFGEPAGTPGTP